MEIEPTRRPVYAQLSLDLFSHPVIRRLRPIERDVYWRLLIAACACKGKAVAISRSQIAESVNTGELDADGRPVPAHPKTIQKALRELAADPGSEKSRRSKAKEPPLIERTEQIGRSSRYRVLYPSGTWDHHAGLWKPKGEPTGSRGAPEGGSPKAPGRGSQAAPPPVSDDSPLRSSDKSFLEAPLSPPSGGPKSEWWTGVLKAAETEFSKTTFEYWFSHVEETAPRELRVLSELHAEILEERLVNPALKDAVGTEGYRLTWPEPEPEPEPEPAPRRRRRR